MTDNLQNITSDIPAALLILLVNRGQAVPIQATHHLLENKYTLCEEWNQCKNDCRCPQSGYHPESFWSIQHQPTLKFKQGDITRLQHMSHIIDVMLWYRYIKLARSHYEISPTVTSISVNEDRLLDSCVGLKRIQISWNDQTLWKNLCILLHLLKKKWLQTVIVLKKARNLIVWWGGRRTIALLVMLCLWLIQWDGGVGGGISL